MPPRSSASHSGRSGALEVLAGEQDGPERLRALLADLGSQIRRGRGLAREVVEERPCCPTGITGLDARLGGGFPRGRMSELCGAPSSGRTSLAMALLAETLAPGGLAAWIDPADAFDPASAATVLAERGETHGGERRERNALSRLLWVRARSEKEALRSCERVLACEGFELVLLDLASHPISHLTSPKGHAPRPAVGGIRDAHWLRLARLAARQRSALVVLTNAPQTGHHAELVLELERRRARFSRPPVLLDALECTARLRRHRTRPLGPALALSLAVDADSEAARERAHEKNRVGLEA